MAKKIKYLFEKILSRLHRDPDERMCRYFRKNGVKVGNNCHIYSNIITSEPYLITIGNNVTISSDVIMITHDNSIIKVDDSLPNLLGEIKIGDNCFIGERATILYGVDICNNVIVAASSVVCNSFSEERIIIGGNPAKKIGTWDSFLEKNKSFGVSRKNCKEFLEHNPEKLVKRKKA